MPVNLSTFLIGCVSVVATMVGYKLIHGLAAFLSVVAGGALIVAFIWMVWVNGLPEHTFHSDGFSVAGFYMATVSVAALWQIAYALTFPTTPDICPRTPGCAPRSGPPTPAACWARPAHAARRTSRRRPAQLGHPRWHGHLTQGVTTGVFIVFAVGVAATNSMDLYCGSLSTITIGQNIFPDGRPAPSTARSPRSSCSASR